MKKSIAWEIMLTCMFEIWFCSNEVCFVLVHFFVCASSWLCIRIVHTLHVQQHMHNANELYRILLCPVPKRQTLHLRVALLSVVAFIAHAVFDWRFAACAGKADVEPATIGVVGKSMVVA